MLWNNMSYCTGRSFCLFAASRAAPGRILGTSHRHHKEGFTVHPTSSSPWSVPHSSYASSSSIADLLMPRSSPCDLIQGRSGERPRGGWGPSAADVATGSLGMDDAQGKVGRRRPGHDEWAIQSHLKLLLMPRKMYFFSLLCCCAIANFHTVDDLVASSEFCTGCVNAACSY
jgi:hypothetical protein